MSIATQSNTLDNNLDLRTLAILAESVFLKIMDVNAEQPEDPDPGFALVAQDVIAIDASTEMAAVSMTGTELGKRLRGVYRQSFNIDDDEDALIEPRELAAWKGVAHLLCYACQWSADDDKAASVDSAAEMIISQVQQELEDS